MNFRKLFLTLLIWGVLTVAFVLIGVVALDWRRSNGLAKYGVAINASVDGKEPENHDFIRYSYNVNGSHYSGLGSAGGENPGFDDLHVGERSKLYTTLGGQRNQYWEVLNHTQTPPLEG